MGEVSISQLLESYVREHYQGNVAQQLQDLESSFNEFKAIVLPVVAKVADLIQEFEQDGGFPAMTRLNQCRRSRRTKRCTGRSPGRQPRAAPAPVEPPPRRRWPWQG